MSSQTIIAQELTFGKSFVLMALAVLRVALVSAFLMPTLALVAEPWIDE